MKDCIFCKIINKEVPKEIIFESDSLVVFEDINPSADLHLLIVPKEHIGAIADIGQNQANLLVEIYQTVNKLTEENNLTDDLYRVVVNGESAAHTSFTFPLIRRKLEENGIVNQKEVFF